MVARAVPSLPATMRLARTSGRARRKAWREAEALRVNSHIESQVYFRFLNVGLETGRGVGIVLNLPVEVILNFCAVRRQRHIVAEKPIINTTNRTARAVGEVAFADDSLAGQSPPRETDAIVSHTKDQKKRARRTYL